MESKSFTGLIFLLLLFFASQEGVDGRVCQTPSHRFKGTCLNYRNCAAVCRQEGFSGGRCVGFRRRCFCTRNC